MKNFQLYVGGTNNITYRYEIRKVMMLLVFEYSTSKTSCTKRSVVSRFALCQLMMLSMSAHRITGGTLKA